MRLTVPSITKEMPQKNTESRGEKQQPVKMFRNMQSEDQNKAIILFFYLFLKFSKTEGSKYLILQFTTYRHIYLLHVLIFSLFTKMTKLVTATVYLHTFIYVLYNFSNLLLE